MKKVLSLLLVLLMLLSLCACGDGDDSATDPTQEKIYDPSTAVGSWFLEGINNEGTEYETVSLTLGDGTASINIAYFGKLEYSSQEMLDFILENGYYSDGENTQYYYDIKQYNGVYYCSAMYGMSADGTYTVDGNTITLSLTTYHELTGNMVLYMTSETTVNFVSVDESLFDEIIREVLNNGKVFNKTEQAE